jgi:hypothetical protein
MSDLRTVNCSEAEVGLLGSDHTLSLISPSDHLFVSVHNWLPILGVLFWSPGFRKLLACAIWHPGYDLFVEPAPHNINA